MPSDLFDQHFDSGLVAWCLPTGVVRTGGNVGTGIHANDTKQAAVQQAVTAKQHPYLDCQNLCLVMRYAEPQNVARSCCLRLIKLRDSHNATARAWQVHAHLGICHRSHAASLSLTVPSYIAGLCVSV